MKGGELKRKIKACVPFVILFAAPWTHKLIYLNLRAAWPEMDSATAHGLGIGGAILAFIFSMLLIEAPY